MLSIISKQTREKTNRQGKRHTRKNKQTTTKKKTKKNKKNNNKAYALTKWNQLLVTENSFKLRIWLIYIYIYIFFERLLNLRQKEN